MIRFLASLVANGNCRVCWVFGAVLTVAGSLLPSKLHLPTIFANILWPLACYWRPGSLNACRLFQNSSFLESFYQVIFSFSACAWVVESIHQNLGDHTLWWNCHSGPKTNRPQHYRGSLRFSLENLWFSSTCYCIEGSSSRECGAPHRHLPKKQAGLGQARLLLSAR